MDADQEPQTEHHVPSSAYNALALPPGHSILDYKIQSTLGGGGFGITYLARDINLNLPVAIKEYIPLELAMRGTNHSVSANQPKSESQFNWGLERFLDEARTLATFRHPNIVRVLRYFQANGTAYIVMEYESGESLKHWLPRHTPLDCPTLLSLINPLLEGLELIHKAGFLHRDVKPDNIYIRRDGTPVLLDFGAARRISTGQDLTTIISPGFAPFEQYHAHGNQGPWTDIYSMAAVMYWAISGEKPLDAAARCKQDGMVPATRIDQHQLYDSAFLEAIDWALTPDEAQRPQKVEDFARRLNARIISDPTQLRTPAPTVLHQHDRAASSHPPSVSLSQTAPHRNRVCTVLYLDIANFDTLPANEQFSLKSEFNQALSSKLAAIPETTRITVDTGNGAAICFMGDPEDILLTAIDIQRTLQRHSALRVRVGLHIGPVRVLRDINNHDNVIGDGLSTAQRAMSFAAPNEIVVTRAYYDMVSCLSEHSSARFAMLGERTDKEGRSLTLYTLSDIGGDPDDERTIPLGPLATLGSIASHDVAANNIDPSVAQGMERELTRMIGPLASVLVRKAARIAKTPEDMRTLLAQGLSDPTQKQAFLAGPSAQNKTSSSLHPRSQSSSVRLTNSQTSNSSRRVEEAQTTHTTQGNSVSLPSLSSPSWLDAALAANIERQLAHAIGPVARVVIKRELRSSRDYAQLIAALAQHIDKPDARAQFLQAVARA